MRRLISEGLTPCASADKGLCEIESWTEALSATRNHRFSAQIKEPGWLSVTAVTPAIPGRRGEERNTFPLRPLLANEQVCVCACDDTGFAHTDTSGPALSVRAERNGRGKAAWAQWRE